MMHSYVWPAIASLVFFGANGALAQEPTTALGDSSGAVTKVEVLTPGHGSFASYLNQTVKPAAPIFVLHKGALVHAELQAWAKASGWQLRWLPDVSWKVVGDTSFPNITDVTVAVTEVVNVLREEGRPVRLLIADGNKIMEVTSTDVVSNQRESGGQQ